MNTILAVISGDTVIQAVIWLVIAAVIFGLVNWLIGYVGVQEPFAKVLKVIIAIAAVIICINALMILAGHPFIAW